MILGLMLTRQTILVFSTVEEVSMLISQTELVSLDVQMAIICKILNFYA